MDWLNAQPIWVVGTLLFAIFWLAAFIGRMFHRPVSDKAGSGAESGEPGLIVSASLGLLALLLGFTVSMAVSRYDQRRVATLQEANAIGTFLYRTDLMPANLRAETRQALDHYINARLQVGSLGEQTEDLAQAKRITAEAQAQMWAVVLAVRAEVPEESVKLLIVESANQMFDMATARDAALSARLPTTLVLLLLFFPVASLMLIGYISGKSLGVHVLASTELIVLLTLVLLLIADLNRPRSGTILTPQGPLIDVRAQLDASRAASATSLPASE